MLRRKGSDFSQKVSAHHPEELGPLARRIFSLNLRVVVGIDLQRTHLEVENERSGKSDMYLTHLLQSQLLARLIPASCVHRHGVFEHGDIPQLVVDSVHSIACMRLKKCFMIWAEDFL